MAIVFYVTNYATKVEDPVWKRVAAAAEVFPLLNDPTTGDQADAAQGGGEADKRENRTRQFLMRVANRIFTERALSQVEVVSHLLGYPTEFANNVAWTFLNVSSLYCHIFRRWPHLRQSASGTESLDEHGEETILLEEAGQKISFVQAYQHRGRLLRGLSFYDYMSVVKLKRKGRGTAAWGEAQFDSAWPPSRKWVQELRRPGKHAVVCLDGYLSMDFGEEEETYCRAAVQHLALFVPWESFLTERSGDINTIWERRRKDLPRRVSFLADNIQLLRRSAEDVKRDARQWAALSGETDPTADADESGITEGGKGPGTAYRPDNIGNAIRLIDVLRNTVGSSQITAGSKEISTMVQQLYRFQVAALCSTDELRAMTVLERGPRTLSVPGRSYWGAGIPGQEQVRSIKSQQVSASKERERMIQGIQNQPSSSNTTGHSAALYSALNGFGEDDIHITAADSESLGRDTGPSTSIRFGPATSFSEVGRRLAESFTLNRKQSAAFRIICRQLDRVRRNERGTPQLCQFIGGEGGTGKSRIIEALGELFASRGMSHRLLVTATSGTAAARINGVTIHSACNFSKDAPRAGSNRNIDGVKTSNSADLYINGQARMDWQEKYMLIIDEVSMLGARTLYAVNEQLCRLRGCTQDFGGIPIILFCGDFHQFRPVQERSIILPSTAIPWDEEKSFRTEQRYQHDKAHALWKKFTTVVMLNEQVRAAGDSRLQRLLTRVRRGIQDQSDVEFLNSTCYQEGRRIPWESGITVVTPLNRNRWNLNIEAALSFQKQWQAPLRIFISEHKWKDGQPTEEEALMILSQGDDSAIPVPAISYSPPACRSS
ncbi:hypothetical protein RB600_008933 [Gaeumannomyces tritici]